jgi:hypothetical protein
MLYYGYTIGELMLFGLTGVVLLWSFFRILTVDKHDSKFFYYFSFAATLFLLWAWRSGNGYEFYQLIRNWIGTPD